MNPLPLFGWWGSSLSRSELIVSEINLPFQAINQVSTSFPLFMLFCFRSAKTNLLTHETFVKLVRAIDK